MSNDSPKAEALKAKYPRLFRSDQPRGIECSDGWLHLLDMLCFELDRELSLLPPEIQNDMYVTLAKEKFGSLSFSMSRSTPFMRGAIAMAENMSYDICEECGAPAVTRNATWIKTLCDQHHEERNKRIS